MNQNLHNQLPLQTSSICTFRFYPFKINGISIAVFYIIHLWQKSLKHDKNNFTSICILQNKLCIGIYRYFKSRLRIKNNRHDNSHNLIWKTLLHNIEKKVIRYIIFTIKYGIIISFKIKKSNRNKHDHPQKARKNDFVR